VERKGRELMPVCERCLSGWELLYSQYYTNWQSF